MGRHPGPGPAVLRRSRGGGVVGLHQWAQMALRVASTVFLAPLLSLAAANKLALTPPMYAPHPPPAPTPATRQACVCLGTGAG